MKQNFIDIDQFTKHQILTIIKQAIEIKKNPLDYRKALDFKSLCLILEKHSTRTRISFEVAINQLGGNAVIIDAEKSQIVRGESISDTAKVISRYCDFIAYRANKHTDLLELANNADIPVINALTDYSHPCQILADFVTITEHFGSFEDLQFTWVGDVNNVLESFIQMSNLFDVKLNICVPKVLHKKIKIDTKNITLFDNKFDGVKNSNVIITDTWVSMGDNYEKEAMFKDFTIDEKTMLNANKNAIFMHCMPIYREKEVTTEIVNKNQQIIFNEAENRLHAQKSVLLFLS